MQRRRACQAFDGCDLASGNLPGGDQASADRFAIQQDRAGAAVARIATYFRSRQPEIVAQHAREPARVPVDGHLNTAPIHGE